MPSYVAEVYFKVKAPVEWGPSPFVIQDAEHEILIHAPSLESAKTALFDEYNNYSRKNKNPNYLGLNLVHLDEHPNPAGLDTYPWTKVITIE